MAGFHRPGLEVVRISSAHILLAGTLVCGAQETKREPKKHSRWPGIYFFFFDLYNFDQIYSYFI